jgi:hypothetical protein
VSRATPLLSLDDEAPEVALGNDTPEFAGFFRVDQRPRGRDVRIFAQLRNKVIVTGDTIPAKAITEILFSREQCPLTLADKRGMYRAWRNAHLFDHVHDKP